MKKFSLVLLALLLAGCYTVRVYINMPESEFLSKYRAAALVEMSAQRDVYSMQLYSGGQYVTKYFYFVNHKLIQTDEGVRRPDIVIQHN